MLPFNKGGEEAVSNAEQVDYWNGEAGKRWAEDDDGMARLLRPVCEALLDHADLAGSRRALDVGCGGGSQSVMLAERLGEGAQVLGVDISGPMLEVAAARVAASQAGRATIEFLQADASDYPFEPGSFDLVFSRFGVMFFDDPVAAFRNLHGALAPGGRLAFCCWQPMKANAWARLPLEAALQHLPPPEPPPPDAPGPFAFGKAERVEGILTEAGFSAVSLQPLLTQLHFSPALTLGEAVRELARIGPLSRLLAQHPDAPTEKIFASVEAALQPWFRPGALELPVAIWLVGAVRP